MTFPGSIQTAIGAPGNMRIGRITAVNPVAVTLENTVLDPSAVGFLNGYIPALDDVVAISGQSAQPSARSASWLVHGRIDPATALVPALTFVVINFEATTENTSSATFVDMTGASVNFSKVRSDSALIFTLLLSGFTTSAASAVEYQVLFNSSIAGFATRFLYNTTSEHHSAGGSNAVLGVDAGPVSAQIQWRLALGAGPVRTDTNDRISLLITESLG